LWQATDFADHVVSGALTAEFAAEVERLRAQHADAVREKSAAESKSRRLTERLAAMEVEKGDLRRQLVEERREANKAIADAQAAQAEAKLARAKGSLARQRAEELEARLNILRNHVDKAKASTRAEVERTHAQFVDAYRELGARTAAFEAPGQEVGLRFLEWLQEELGVLPTIVMGLMSFASIVTCEGAVNALSREGCGHFEVFDQSDENFKREIF
jgi:chromosome segregation ATPase